MLLEHLITRRRSAPYSDPKWSREQHLTDLGSAISWAMMDLQRYRDMIAKCKEAQSRGPARALYFEVRAE